jgi:glucosamine-6-phosphate deaminase
VGKAPRRIFDTPEDIGEHLATRLLAEIEQARRSGRRYLLGCPTGRTPKPLYAAIARSLAAKPQDLSCLTLVMMDEYVVAQGSAYQYAAADNEWSCHHFVRALIVEPWNRALKSELQLRDESIWFPDPRDPSSYDAKIAEAGGIDFFVLASGASDGHVAFNPPGSRRDSTTRIVALSPETRRDNLSTFPAFGSLANVPSHGVTVGIGTIARARAKAMVITGEGKRMTLRRIEAADGYEPDWPATVIHEGTDGEVLCDRAALQQSSDGQTKAGRT